LGLLNFSNLQLIFNASKPGNTAQQGITLDLLSLTLWNPKTGGLLGAFYQTEPFVIAGAFPGVGNAVYGFRLESVQFTSANQLLAAFPNLFLGVAAKGSGETGGKKRCFFV